MQTKKAQIILRTGQFVSYLVADPEDKFSRDEAHIVGVKDKAAFNVALAELAGHLPIVIL